VQRLSLLVLLSLISGCDDSKPAEFGAEGQPCVVNGDCALALACVNDRCGPIDRCAAGIYVADDVPARPDDSGAYPFNAFVRQTSGLANGIRLDEDMLRVTQDGEPRIFSIDFYDDLNKPATEGLFVEARLQLGPDSNECSAVMALWPTRTDQIKLCFGGGRIGLAQPDGGSTELVDDVPDLTQLHTYRISFKPAAAEDEAQAGSFVIELEIDGALAASALTIDELPNPAAPSDRAPLIEFGAEAQGTVAFDFVRWGCNPDGAACRTDEQDDDECDTERMARGGCDGAAVAIERCDDIDNDCDGLVDEDYRGFFPEGRPVSFNGFGSEAFKDDRCGLIGTCADARVVCSEDGLHLVCDASEFIQDEICDGQDNDCDGLFDEDFSSDFLDTARHYLDPVSDARLPLGAACGRGACAGGAVTCEDALPVCSTRRVRQDNETCGNAVDDDCDGVTDEGFDVDGDGYQSCQRCVAEPCNAGPHDCNDVQGLGARINPDITEVCNGIDDNCNGQIDEGLDLDGDGFLTCDPVPDCRNDPSDDVEGAPTAFEVNPAADEACDEADNDCDGRVDEGFAQLQPDGSVIYTSRSNCGRCGNDCSLASDEYNTIATCAERPGGGFGCSTVCRPGFYDVDGDVAIADQFWNAEDQPDSTGCECRVRADTICDSGDVNRACAEICNGVDDDCDGVVDEDADMDLPGCWDGPPEQRNVGVCFDGVRRCIDGRISEQCFGSTQPDFGQERICDGRDEDCDGLVDEGNPLTDPTGELRTGDACDTGLDGICAAGLRVCGVAGMQCEGINGPGIELCNGLDDDCDGVFEEDTDADGDGAPRCRPCDNGEAPNPDGFCEFDCNDSAANGREGVAFSPNINERCTGNDNDCDERVDEDFVLTDDLGHPVALNGERVFTVQDLVYNQVANCGGCGVECARTYGLTSCDQGVCILVDCRVGFLDLDGDPDNGCEASDCRPDNVGAQRVALIGTLCSKPMYDDASACACVGTFQCQRRGGVPSVECIVDPGNVDEADIVPPAECPADQRVNVVGERCDGSDNDCDGAADEDFVLRANGQPILDNEGDVIYSTPEHCGGCGALCSPPFTLIAACENAECGIERCMDGRVDLNGVAEDGCEYACALSGPEGCDGADNDCDGAVDEGLDGCVP
jgi:Notch-like protein